MCAGRATCVCVPACLRSTWAGYVRQCVCMPHVEGRMCCGRCRLEAPCVMLEGAHFLTRERGPEVSQLLRHIILHGARPRGARVPHAVGRCTRASGQGRHAGTHRELPLWCSARGWAAWLLPSCGRTVPLAMLAVRPHMRTPALSTAPMLPARALLTPSGAECAALSGGAALRQAGGCRSGRTATWTARPTRGSAAAWRPCRSCACRRRSARTASPAAPRATRRPPRSSSSSSATPSPAAA